jgi:hypothetical protein
MSNEVIYQYLNGGSYTLTVPSGYSNQVLVYAWGAGGGAGYAGTAGGGGGYAAGVVTMNAGDNITVSIGSAGASGNRTDGGAGGSGNNPIIDLNGGSSGTSQPIGGDDNNIGNGGGGGGASSIFVNGVAQLVAAGGGGGGGGSGYQTGTGGSAGGVYSSTSSNPRGSDSAANYATGGAGGGGYPYGGAAGNSVGDDQGGPSGGQGGQNYANASVASSTLLAGSGSVPGGTNTSLYPATQRGYSTYDGAVIIVFQKLFTGWIKNSGAWKSISNGWIKLPDSVITVTKENVGTSVTNAYTAVGTANWTVPADVNSVLVTYPTPSGLVKTLVTVTPGQVIPITIGDYGQASSFGSLVNAPGYDTQVFSYSGNVDNDKSNIVQIATPNGASYASPAGSFNDAQTAGAAAVGIVYKDGSPSEGWHGDLPSTITINTVYQSSLVTNYQVYVSGGSGREFPSHHSIQQQPTASNGYQMWDYQYDGSGGEGTYSWTTNLQQQGYIKVDYTPVIPPTYLTVHTGGWKQILQGWIKNNGIWKSVATPLSLNPVKSSGVPASPVSINLVIAANTVSYDLTAFLAGTSYYPGYSVVTLTVNSGVTVGSTDVLTPAINIDGLTAGDQFTLINNGTIVGRGGDGGAAGTYTISNGSYVNGKYGPVWQYNYAPKGGTPITTGSSIPGRQGLNGGIALLVNYLTTLINNGTIAGGGGGGGGGGGPTGGQGGGGAGTNVGIGGHNGTATTGGAGSGYGGAGGALGQPGTAGTNDSNAGGAGGLAGTAIVNSSKVAIQVTGTIIGPIA